ncbi:MAG: DUF4113 domain-containing protein [Mesorhizobium sp.]|nr:DUF4113 domain-containing protein [Mesorhizobium sp.]
MAPSIAQRAWFDRLDHEGVVKIMAAMDGVDMCWGHAMVVHAAVCIAAKSAVSAKLEMRSPRFTTRWEELSKRPIGCSRHHCGTYRNAPRATFAGSLHALPVEAYWPKTPVASFASS